MELLELAIASQIPLISATTDDIVYIEEVLNFVSKTQVSHVQLPQQIKDTQEIVHILEAVPANGGKRVVYTSDETKSMAKIYRAALQTNTTVIFINAKKSSLFFDVGALLPPKELIKHFLVSELLCDTEEEATIVLPAFGGMTLKDVLEASKMTLERDGTLTLVGVNSTRRAYLSQHKGLSQIDTKIGFYKVPFPLKQWMAKNKMFFMEDVHKALTPRGILMDGKPGTGKTMAAKFIASEFGVPLYRLDLGGMMGKYVGDSETALSNAIAQLDIVQPCVVLFDEAEKVFNTGTQDSGVTSRLMSQLLWWLQEHTSRVFSVMTTNAVMSIPPELTREGRIDTKLTFNGITGWEEGREFAEEALAVFSSEINCKFSDEQKKEYLTAVKNMFHGEGAVPQVKITQAMYELARVWLSQSKEAGNGES